MIVLRKSFSKEENENYIKLPKISTRSVGAAGLLGLGGYLIGSSGKKATEKRIGDRLRHIDYKIDQTVPRYLEGLKDIDEWKTQRLQKEGEIVDKKLRSLDRNGGIFKGLKKSSIKKKAKRRRDFIENNLVGQKQEKLKASLSQERANLKSLRKDIGRRIKMNSGLRRGLGNIALASGMGLAAYEGYRYYKNNYDSIKK